jgi:uncharacterized membrane protein
MYGFSWGILRSVTEARMHDDEKHRFIEEGQYIGVMMVSLSLTVLTVLMG